MFGSVSIVPSYSYSYSRHSCAKRPFAIAIRYYERKKCLFCVIVGVCMCFLLPHMYVRCTYVLCAACTYVDTLVVIATAYAAIAFCHSATMCGTVTHIKVVC